MHKKTMKKCASKLMKDAKHYEKESKKSNSSVKKIHDNTEKKEALAASKDLKKRAKKAHEY